MAGPFTKELRNPAWPAELSHLLGGPVEVHYVACPSEIRRRRLEERGEARDLAKLRAWEQYIQYYGEERPPVFAHVLVDGAGSNEEKRAFWQGIER